MWGVRSFETAYESHGTALRKVWCRVVKSDCINQWFSTFSFSQHTFNDNIKNLRHTEVSDRVLEQYLFAEVVVLGNFNTQDQEWLRKKALMAYGLSLLVTQPTPIPDIERFLCWTFCWPLTQLNIVWRWTVHLDRLITYLSVLPYRSPALVFEP